MVLSISILVSKLTPQNDKRSKSCQGFWSFCGVNLKIEIELSRTEQDLRMIRDKIRTEIRFSGLENDQLLHRMIRHKFGISLQNI